MTTYSNDKRDKRLGAEPRGPREEPSDVAVPIGTNTPAASQSPRKMKGVVWVLVVVSVISSIFLFALDNTIVADVQPRVVETLGDIDKLPWISVTFSMAAFSVDLIWYGSPDPGVLSSLC